MKQITIKDVEITVTAEEETISVRGNAIASGDNAYDKKIEDQILRRLQTNEWAWCTANVTVKYKGLEATEYLGCCSYKNEKDFIKNSGYYEDMVQTCLDELNEQAKAIVTELQD